MSLPPLVFPQDFCSRLTHFFDHLIFNFNPHNITMFRRAKGHIAFAIEPLFQSSLPLGTNTFLEVALGSSALLFRETPRLLNLLDRIFHPATNPLSSGNTKENLFPSTSQTVQNKYCFTLLVSNSSKYRLPIFKNIAGLSPFH